jgi:hypothetical protein
MWSMANTSSMAMNSFTSCCLLCLFLFYLHFWSHIVGSSCSQYTWNCYLQIISSVPKYAKIYQQPFALSNIWGKFLFSLTKHMNIVCVLQQNQIKLVFKSYFYDQFEMQKYNCSQGFHRVWNWIWVSCFFRFLKFDFLTEQLCGSLVFWL